MASKKKKRPKRRRRSVSGAEGLQGPDVDDLEEDDSELDDGPSDASGDQGVAAQGDGDRGEIDERGDTTSPARSGRGRARRQVSYPAPGAGSADLPKEGSVSTHGGLVFVGIVLGLIILAVVAQLFVGG